MPCTLCQVQHAHSPSAHCSFANNVQRVYPRNTQSSILGIGKVKKHGCVKVSGSTNSGNVHLDAIQKAFLCILDLSDFPVCGKFRDPTIAAIILGFRPDADCPVSQTP